MNYPDNELTYFLRDNNENAINLIYQKYKYIIDVLINKYKMVFYALNIDTEEIRQEANLAFSNAIYSYQDDKDTSLSTFITLCVERKIKNIIKKYESNKNKILSEAMSLDNNSYDTPLENIIGDDKYEPLRNLETKDTIEYINTEVKKILSSSEYEVYKLMLNGLNYIEISNKLNKTPKQIDNSIQRIRAKLKKIKEKNYLYIDT